MSEANAKRNGEACAYFAFVSQRSCDMFKTKKGNAMYTIEKNVPIPENRGRLSKYPFGEMELGDSFVVEKEKMNTIRTNCSTYGKSHKKKFVVRKDGDKIRCWRIK